MLKWGSANWKIKMVITVLKRGSLTHESPYRNGNLHIEMVIYISPFWNRDSSVMNPFWNSLHSNLGHYPIWNNSKSGSQIQNGYSHVIPISIRRKFQIGESPFQKRVCDKSGINICVIFLFPPHTRCAWAGGTCFQLCCCVSFWFWREIYLLIYLEYNTFVVLCQFFGSGGK